MERVWNVLDNLKWFTTCQLLAGVNVIYQDYIQYCNECLCKSKAVAAGGAYLQTFDPPWLFAVAILPFRPTLEISTWTPNCSKLKGKSFSKSWRQSLVTVQFARNSFETTSLEEGIKLWGFTDSLCKWYLWLIRCVRTKVRTTLPCECRVLPLFFFQKPSADGFGPPAKAVELLAVLELEHLEADSISYTTATWNHQMTGVLSRIRNKFLQLCTTHIVDKPRYISFLRDE